jgi:hypothetical protein
MNDELIYKKTTAGEEAVRERTRLVQRNLRMVLILVDGEIDVAAVKRQTGNPAMVESALSELESMGLIELATADATPPTDEAPVATDFEVEAADDLGQIPVLREEAPPSEPVAALLARPLAPSADFDDDTVPPWGPVSRTPVEPPPAPPKKPSPLAGITAWWEARKRRKQAAREEAVFAQAYEEEAVPASAPVEAEPGGALKTKRRRKALIAMLAVAAVILAALAALLRVLFYPYDEYRPAFERHLAAMLDDRVSIGLLRVTFAPMPILWLEKVAVGDGAYATAETIRLLPEPASLLGDRLRFLSVSVDGLVVRDAAFASMGRWFSGNAASEAGLPAVELTRLSVALGPTVLSELSGSAQYDAAQRQMKVSLRAKEGGLAIEALPGAAGVAITATASEWKAPFQPALVLAGIEVSGSLAPGRLMIGKVEARGYEGVAAGSGALSWTAGGAQLALNLNLQNIALAQLLPVFEAPLLLDGSVDGKLAVTAAAAAPNRLDQALRMEGGFRVSRGNLKRIDLAGALRPDQQTGGTTRGGHTAFEDLTGTLSADPRSVRLNNLRLSSGLMQAYGQASIARPAGTISGNASVELRGSTGTIRAPVSLSGQASDPELKSAR